MKVINTFIFRISLIFNQHYFERLMKIRDYREKWTFRSGLIEYFIGIERHSGSMDAISPLYVSRMLNVLLEEVEKCMKEMGILA